MDLKTRHYNNIYKMTDFTISNNNHFISKYGKTLHQLTWFTLPPAEDPLDIMKNEPMLIKPIVKDKTKEKTPMFIPKEIMSNILSYLPKPVLKPQEYGIMNNKYNDGCFMIIKKITPKFVVYDRYKLFENGHNIVMLDENKRSKLRKDKTRRYYYIFYNNDEYIVDNKLPVRNIYLYGDLNRILLITEEQYRQTLRGYYYYYSEDDTLPINIEV